MRKMLAFCCVMIFLAVGHRAQGRPTLADPATVLTVPQARAYAAGAGFWGENLDIIIAIAEEESGLNPLATHTHANGSVDRGLYQISSHAHPEVSDQCAFDPACASAAAWTISAQGTDFSQWDTYKDGSYLRYLHPALSIVGNGFVDADGIPRQLQGATLSGLEYRCTLGGRYTPADFLAMRDRWNMNVVKIPVNPHFWRGQCPGGVTSDSYKAAVSQAVSNARGVGLYVILVMLDYNLSTHSGNPAPDWATFDTARDLASQYGADGRVMLETFSEPHNISNATWLRGVQKQIDVINAAAPQMMILIDGPNWSGVPGLAYAAGYRPHGRNLAYAAHIYDQVSNANPANWPRDFAQLAQTYPLVATEFGDVTHACGATWLNMLMPYMADHLAGWLFWAWDVGTSCTRPDTLVAWDGTPNGYGAAIQAFYLRR